MSKYPHHFTIDDKLEFILIAIWRLESQIMGTVLPGLAAIQQAETDIEAAVSAAVAKISDLSSQLSALNSEDPAVQALAAKFEQAASALNAAVSPAPTV